MMMKEAQDLKNEVILVLFSYLFCQHAFEVDTFWFSRKQRFGQTTAVVDPRSSFGIFLRSLSQVSEQR